MNVEIRRSKTKCIFLNLFKVPASPCRPHVSHLRSALNTRYLQLVHRLIPCTWTTCSHLANRDLQLRNMYRLFYLNPTTTRRIENCYYYSVLSNRSSVIIQASIQARDYMLKLSFHIRCTTYMHAYTHNLLVRMRQDTTCSKNQKVYCTEMELEAGKPGTSNQTRSNPDLKG